jgi:hypothetical protein
MERNYKISEASFLTDIDINLVKKCDEAGYKAIAVSCYDPEVSISDNWHNRHKVKFIAGEPDTKSKLKGRNDAWPAIWKIVDILGGSAGCGNSHQKQLKNDHLYSECSYRKINGEWYVFNVEKSLAKLSTPYGI